MLQVSNDAMTLLKDALDSECERPEDLFRLVLDDDKLALSLDASQEGDVVFEQDGVPVLATPVEIAEGLSNRQVNIEESAQGPRLILTEE